MIQEKKKKAHAIVTRRQIASVLMMKKNIDYSLSIFPLFKKTMELFVTHMSDLKYLKGT